MKTWKIMVASVAAFGPMGLLLAAGEEEPVGIRVFEAVPGDQREAAGLQPFAKLSRYVTINTGALFGEAGERGAIAADRVVLNLFDGRSVEAFRDARDLGLGNVPTWYGVLPEEAGGYVLFVMTEGGYVSGKVHSPTFGLYEIAATGPAGISVVRELDEPAMPGCGVGRAQEVNDIPRGAVGPVQFDMPMPDEQGRRGVVATPGEPVAGASGARGGTILFADVLIAYTPAARTAAGGVNQIASIITAAVGDSNVAYTNSDVDLRIRAAQIVETQYVESSTDMGLDLDRLRSTNDGNMDELHTIRNTIGADLISLIVTNSSGGACGIGYLMTNVSNSFASSAVSVTARTCISNLTFQHELGHNMGLSHDRDNAGGSSWPYAYGYRTPDNAFRTVMAYAPGTRVNVFSNPNVTVSGRVMGNPVDHPTNPAFNALALNNNAFVISTWRNNFTAAPGPFSLSVPAMGSTTANRTPLLSWGGADQGDYYRLLVDNSPAFTSPEIDIDPLSATQYQVPPRILAPGTLYNWRVVAVNPLGQSNSSPVTGTFTTAANPPAAFSTTVPTASATAVSANPVFSWQDALDADTFGLQVDNDPNFGSLEINLTGLTSTQYIWGGAPLQSLTTYYWRMTATNAIGTTPSSPAANSFTVIGLSPGPFNLSSPADGANITSLRPTLTWTASSSATTYRLIVDNDLNMQTPVYNQGGLTGTSQQLPAGVLANQTRYYWQVQAQNITATTNSSPAIYTFATLAPTLCQGDANRDNFVNFVDISTVLTNFGGSGPQGDANGDSAVNFVDVSTVLSNYGVPCP